MFLLYYLAGNKCCYISLWVIGKVLCLFFVLVLLDYFRNLQIQFVWWSKSLRTAWSSPVSWRSCLTIGISRGTKAPCNSWSSFWISLLLNSLMNIVCPMRSSKMGSKYCLSFPAFCRYYMHFLYCSWYSWESSSGSNQVSLKTLMCQYNRYWFSSDCLRLCIFVLKDE